MLCLVGLDIGELRGYPALAANKVDYGLVVYTHPASAHRVINRIHSLPQNSAYIIIVNVEREHVLQNLLF